MDVGLSEEQEMLKHAAHDALADLCPSSVVRAAEARPSAALELWPQFAELDWLGLPFPEDAGGSGADLLTLLALVEELGYAAVPGPFLATVAQAGLAILEAGSTDQRQQYLSSIAKGRLIASLAVAEEGARFSIANLKTTLRAEGDGFVLSGEKAYVPQAELAELFVVVAAGPGDGLSLVLVNKDDAGVSVEPKKSLAGEPLGSLRLDSVQIAAERVLGEAGQARAAVERVLTKALLAETAYIVGAAEKAFNMAVQYAAERVQFGRPIGSFEAIAHKCADMAIDLDGARLLLYRAAWMLDENEPSEGAVAEAKVWSGEAGRRIIASAHQVHGAIGFTGEYDLNLFTRRIKAHEFVFGQPGDYLATIANDIGLAVAGA